MTQEELQKMQEALETPGERVADQHKQQEYPDIAPLQPHNFWEKSETMKWCIEKAQQMSSHPIADLSALLFNAQKIYNKIMSV